MDGKDDLDKEELKRIIVELQSMMMHKAILSPDEVTKQEQRLNEIEVFINEKAGVLAPHMCMIIKEIKGRINGK